MTLGTIIKISGSGFDVEPTNNKVMIGGVSCTVTASTTSTIKCTIGVGPLGAHKVMVTVAGKGYAEHSSGNVTFSYDANITSIDPSSGSQGGRYNHDYLLPPPQVNEIIIYEDVLQNCTHLKK